MICLEDTRCTSLVYLVDIYPHSIRSFISNVCLNSNVNFFFRALRQTLNGHRIYCVPFKLQHILISSRIMLKAEHYYEIFRYYLHIKLGCGMPFNLILKSVPLSRPKPMQRGSHITSAINERKATCLRSSPRHGFIVPAPGEDCHIEVHQSTINVLRDLIPVSRMEAMHWVDGCYDQCE